MLSRRQFTNCALAALPVARAFANINSKFDGVQLGVQSYSFRDLSFNDALQDMVTDGLGICELFAPHIELDHLDKAPIRPRPVDEGAITAGMTKNDAAVARAAARDELRKWRLTVPLSYFENIRQRFAEAGVDLYAYNLSFNDSFTDEEIDRGFDMAKALGVHFITASTTIPVAKRVAPFADKHKMVVAMHGHSDLKDPNQFAKPESFAAAHQMSKFFKTNLDIGHFTAANFDAVDYIEQHHDEIVLLHLKDRKKDEGANTVWGAGNTPIKQVLNLLKTKKYKIPALIEYEYKGEASSPLEVKKCLDYCEAALKA